ncbi:MAG: heme NO-binding domain-containing protein [Pseudomonadota bacterium]
MKGIVFSEFIEMVEERFSPEIADRIIEAAHLPSGGAYTAVGTYDHGEMLALITELARETGLPASDLVREYGRHLFHRFVKLYPGFFENVPTAFDFLDSIENHVHLEVRKLYEDVELPTFDTPEREERRMVMIYESKRPFAALAEGLILGCIEHYGEPISLTQKDLSEPSLTRVRFDLVRNA